MTKSKLQKDKRKKKTVKELKQELKENDEVLKKNHEKPKEQVQVGLYQLGYPPGSPMYDSYLDKMRLDMEDAQIKVDSKLEVLNPIWLFQTSKRWKEIQLEYHKRNIKALKNNIAEVGKQVEKVKKAITVQNERIKARRIQIIDQLKELKVDVSEFTGKVPDYIG